MKLEDAKRSVVDYLIEVKTSDPQTICYQKNVPLVIIYQTIKQLEACGAVKVELNDKKRIVSMIDQDKASLIYQQTTGPDNKVKVFPLVKKVNQEKVNPPLSKPEKPKTPEKAPRDLRKFTFGQEKGLNKGRLVLALLRKYSKDNPGKLDQLIAAWPENEIKGFGYGLIRSAEEAKGINIASKRTRFFVQEEDLIKVEDGYCAITNQMTSEILSRILTIATKFGYTVTIES
jgi:hypothetical protein